jgi:uncharacterized cupin superfamily protein
MAFPFLPVHAFLAVAAAARPFVVASPAETLVTAASAEMVMKPAPIEPDWIIAGAPEARIAEHSQSADSAAMTAIWDCTAGAFRWYFAWDETVMILEGEVHVTDEKGVERVLKAGDIAYFAGKTWATWRVDNYVRKIAFLRRPFPAPLSAAMKLKRLIRRPLRSAL